MGIGFGSVTTKIEAPQCADGYRPVAEAMWRFAQFGAAPTPPEGRYVLSAARRLDAAHGAIERVRDRIERFVDREEQFVGSIEWHRHVFAVIGDAEVAIITLHRAVDMAAKCPKELRLALGFPGFSASKRGALSELRDAYEHIDERALARARRKNQPVPIGVQLSTFDLARSLVVEKKFVYGPHSLGLHDEATKVMIETRDFLAAVWGELNVRAATAAQTTGRANT